MRPMRALWALIALSVLVELVLQAADFGLIGTTRWRGLAYQNGAFWSGLLTNWRPNYTGQSVSMFLTYSLLHSGLAHLIPNMFALHWLGVRVYARSGAPGFWLIFCLSVFGGGVAFAALNSSSAQPMVGASGALFGLAAAALYWHWRDTHRLDHVAGAALGLVALNAGMWWWTDGLLAWQTHLGGFLAGWGAAALMAALLAAQRAPERPGEPL